jgi:arginine N-succinyltransferase
MYVIRDAGPEDFDNIWPIAREFNTVSLPGKQDMLMKVLEISRASFAGELPPADREYVFVLEAFGAEGQGIIGTSMITAQKGSQYNPHVFFVVEQEQKFSPSFAHWLRQREESPEDFNPDSTLDYDILRLLHTFDGPTELGGMFVRPDFRNKRLGARLSYARLLFIAMQRGQHPGLFKDTLLAELLPDLRSQTSPFYTALGRKFTRITYDEADKYSRLNRWFIMDLFPRQAIYVKLLPQDAQDVIGHIGPQSRGAERLLTKVGFAKVNKIHPLDGGPHYEALTEKVPLIGNCFRVSGLCDEDRDYVFEGLLGITRAAPPYFQCVHAEFYRDFNDPSFIRVPTRVLESLRYDPSDTLWAQPWGRKELLTHTNGRVTLG